MTKYSVISDNSAGYSRKTRTWEVNRQHRHRLMLSHPGILHPSSSTCLPLSPHQIQHHHLLCPAPDQFPARLLSCVMQSFPAFPLGLIPWLGSCLFLSRSPRLCPAKWDSSSALGGCSCSLSLDILTGRTRSVTSFVLVFPLVILRRNFWFGNFVCCHFSESKHCLLFSSASVHILYLRLDPS